jgi:hypothetical protein
MAYQAAAAVGKCPILRVVAKFDFLNLAMTTLKNIVMAEFAGFKRGHNPCNCEK